ncbi:retropepsin-like aspartic protease [Asaia bogorensis]|uniref:retropepsin-like aspartic protease n=1 Tax=Asaia bogorensis TaxID=91915 RepID=UPI0013CF0BC0|nr:retropepsin-like aspartic protease [Asaia bogorensis]
MKSARTSLFLVGFMLIPKSVIGSDIQRCIHDTIILPMSNKGGSPLIPATLNGISSHLFFSPYSTKTTIFQHRGLWLQSLFNTEYYNFTGFGVASEADLNSLKLGPLDITNVRVLTFDKRQISEARSAEALGIVGYDILSLFSEYIDSSNQNFYIFKYGGENCPSIGNMLPNSTLVKLVNTGNVKPQYNQVTIVIDGHPIAAKISFTSNHSAVAMNTAKSMGIPFSSFANDPHMRAASGNILLGVYHKFRELKIGDFTVTNPRLAVMRDAEENILGEDILYRFNMILDIPNQEIFLSPANVPYPPPKATVSSPTEMRVASTAVEEEP